MQVIIDDSIEPGRFDAVVLGAPPKGLIEKTVAVNLVLHSNAADDALLVRRLLERTQKMYAGPVHIRAKVYVADFNAALVYVSEVGWNKWREGLVGGATATLTQRAAQQHYASVALAHYRECVREHAPTDDPHRTHCTHEVCFVDGGAIYWAGK